MNSFLNNVKFWQNFLYDKIYRIDFGSKSFHHFVVIILNILKILMFVEISKL